MSIITRSLQLFANKRISRIFISSTIALFLFFIYGNCSDVNISVEQSQKTAQKTGRVCTKTPASLETLNRFIFLIDTSQSMSGIDPADPSTGTTRRIEGLRSLFNDFKNDDNFTIAIGALHGDNAGYLPDLATSVPEAPTLGTACTFFKPRIDQELASLAKAVAQVDVLGQQPSGTSPFKTLLTSARNCVESDLANNSSAQYSVVIVTDGSPTDVTPQQLNDQVRELIQAGKINRNSPVEASRVNIYFYFMDNFNGNPDGGIMMHNAILAAQGAGGFGSRSIVVNNEGPVEYDEIGIFSERRYILKHFAAINMNAALESNGQLGPDSDSDGLTDVIEDKMAGYSSIKHSTEKSCNDSIRFKNGGHCPSTCIDGRQYLDSDHDGLSDCDDFALGTNPYHFDRDGDMIFDGLELRIGSNPLDPMDFSLDMDLDGNNTFTESNLQTGVFKDDKAIRHNALTRISISEVETEDSQHCYDISITQMPLFRTMEVEEETMLPLRHYAGGNVIKLMFYQVTESNPTAPPILQYSYLTLYHGDFQSGVAHISDFSDEDFQIITPSGY